MRINFFNLQKDVMMTIFNIIKKLFSKKPEPACYHYKRAGYHTHENIVWIIRFDERLIYIPWEHYDYGVYECNVCGKRALSGYPCHLRHPDAKRKVDSFINYKMSIKELCDFFDKNKFEYKEERNDKS